MTITELRCVATGSYLVPAAVALRSFIRHNRWFDGAITLCCAPEEAGRMARLLVGLPRVGIRPVDVRLRARADALGCGDRALFPARFWALDLLRHPAEGDVLCLDADIVVTGPLDGLAAADGEIVACGEGAAHHGQAVDRVTNAIASNPTASTIGRTFNSGVLRLAGHLLGPALFEEALAVLDGIDWARVSRRQHDQLVLNRLFEGRWHEIDPTHNFLLRHAAIIHDRWGIGLADARLIHYNVDPRPWDVHAADRIDDPVLAAATRQWLHAHAEAVEQRLLATAVLP